jgi:hypothetical protein
MESNQNIPATLAGNPNAMDALLPLPTFCTHMLQIRFSATARRIVPASLCHGIRDEISQLANQRREPATAKQQQD